MGSRLLSAGVSGSFDAMGPTLAAAIAGDIAAFFAGADDKCV